MSAVVDRLLDQQRRVGLAPRIHAGGRAVGAHFLLAVSEVVGVQGRAGCYAELRSHEDLGNSRAVIRILGQGPDRARALIFDRRAGQLRNVRVDVPVDHRDDRTLARVALAMQRGQLVVGVVLLVGASDLAVDGVRRCGRDNGRADNEGKDSRPEGTRAPTAPRAEDRHDMSSSSSFLTATGLPRRCDRMTSPPRIAAPSTTIPQTM